MKQTIRKTDSGKPIPQVSVVALAVCVMLAGNITQVWAGDKWFNPDLLGTGGNGHEGGQKQPRIDEKSLQRLANGQQLPGTYPVDVYINNHFLSRQNVVMTADGPGGDLTPLWSVNDLLATGVKPSVLVADGQVDMSAALGNRPVRGILGHVPGAHVYFDFGHQRLNVTVPEVSMEKTLVGATDPRFWNEGLTALTSDYNVNAWHNSGAANNSNTASDSAFLSLTNSLNIGAWRAHNFSTWSYNALAHNTDAFDSSKKKVTQRWTSVKTWVDRPIPVLKGLLSLGDRSTPSDVFDSVQFRGVQLATDEDMYPDIMRNFSPVIRGTATSNAQVTVRQKGSIIYQTTVPPGPFTLTDLNASTLSGDYYVTVREADGTEHSFMQGNASVAVMQREGQLRYALTGGRLRSSGINTREPHFLQGTAIWGLPYNMTVYGGLLESQKYQAGSLGLGSVLGLAGALSADVTIAKADVAKSSGKNDDETSIGQAWRLRYSKSIVETGSSVTLAASRYSTKGYYSFADANALSDERQYITTFSTDGIYVSPVVRGRARQEMQLNLNQSLPGGLGSLSLNASRKTFWNLNTDQESVSAIWNMNIKGVGLSLGWQLSRWPGSTQQDDRLVSLMVTLPLSQWLSGPERTTNMYSTTNLSRSNTGRQTLNNNLGGTLLADNQMAWSVGQTSVRSGDENGNNSNSGTINLSYAGSQGKVTTGYSYTPDIRQLSAGLQGVVAVTRYGVTLGQSPGETMALVHAPGASDVKVSPGTGISTDWWGNAVVPAQPYRRNKVDLDRLSVSDNVTLGLTSTEVIPTRGAVVLAGFDTSLGYQVLMTLTHKGSAMPFGTTVNLMHNDGQTSHLKSGTQGGSGIVGDAGQVWLAGMPQSGVLNVSWGAGATGTCQISYQLSEAAILLAKKQHLPVAAKGDCQ